MASPKHHSTVNSVGAFILYAPGRPPAQVENSDFALSQSPGGAPGRLAWPGLRSHPPSLSRASHLLPWSTSFSGCGSGRASIERWRDSGSGSKGRSPEARAPRSLERENPESRGSNSQGWGTRVGERRPGLGRGPSVLARAWVGGRGPGSGFEGQRSESVARTRREGTKVRVGGQWGSGMGARAEEGSGMRGGVRGLGSGGQRSDLGSRARARGRGRGCPGGAGVLRRGVGSGENAGAGPDCGIEGRGRGGG